MKKIITNKYFLLIARILLSVVFIISGIEKINNPGEFAESIENFKMLPIFTINIFAIYFPWLEVVTALLLFFGIRIKENSFLITGMLSIFTFAVVIAVFRNLDIDCGCFGTMHVQKVGMLKILENMILITLGVIILFFHPVKVFSIDHKSNN